MTVIRRRAGYAAAVLLIFSLLLSTVGGGALPRLPEPGDLTTNAAVKIKTQEAADNIEGGIRGIDVSKYQGNINWSKVAGDDVEFAFVRASYGTTADPKFFTNASGAANAGLAVGAYHYATFTNTATMLDEADYLLGLLDQVDLTYPVALDLEDKRHTKLKKNTLTGLAIEFMDILRAEGYDVLLYSNSNFFKNHLNVNSLSDYDLWVANYVEQPNGLDHVVWQHTSYGTVKGISGRVDINIAYSDLSHGRRPASSNSKLDKGISNSIKQTLNERYNTKLSTSSTDLAKVNTAITKGVEYEINRQWGVDFPVTGQLSQEQFNTLAEVKFTSSTKGNITYLIQAKLFFKGYYSKSPTSKFDSGTVEALKRFQKASGLEVTGKLTTATLHKLLRAS